MIARAKPKARDKARERRIAARQTINRRAQYVAALGALPRDCLVINVSDGGARLYAEPALPDTFTLMVSGDGAPFTRECHVVWRLGGECGVAFVGRR
ncbi:MAG: PilZ domain-containing protein [Pseudolabrys sp.]